MSVEFHEEQAYRIPAAKPLGGITGFLVRSKYAKDEAQARIILLVTAMLLALLAGAVWLFSAPSGASLTPEEYLELGP